MHPLRFLAFASLIGAAVSPAVAQTRSLKLSPDADTHVRIGGPNANTNYGDSQLMETLQYGSERSYIMYVRFDLSVVPLDAIIEDVTLSFTYAKGGSRTDKLTEDRLAVYGLQDVTGNTPQQWQEKSLTGATIGGEVVAQSGTQFDTSYRVISFDGKGEFVVGGDSVGCKAGLNTSPELVKFVERRIQSGDGRCVTFMVDNTVTTVDGRGYAFATKENEDVDARPSLEIKFRRIGSGSEPRLGPRR